jgi:hypothetical protein
MHRIDTGTAVLAPPAPAAPGPNPNGYWQPGVVGTGQQATGGDQDFFNMIQEELGAFLDAAQIARVKGTYNQVLTSCRALFGGFVQSKVVVTAPSNVQVNCAPGLDGNRIVINGFTYLMPAAGVTATINNNTATVNGVANQSLAASTLYYFYWFISGGALALDFWTGANAVYMVDTTAGNIGNVVRKNAGAPDSTRTLCGMLLTDAAVHVNDTVVLRTLRSWTDRRRKTLVGVAQSSTTTSATYVEANVSGRVSACLWAGEAISLSTFGSMSVNLANGVGAVAVGMDGAIYNNFGNSVTSPISGANEGANSSFVNDGLVSEGAHNFNALFQSNGTQTVTLSSAIVGTIGG